MTESDYPDAPRMVDALNILRDSISRLNGCVDCMESSLDLLSLDLIQEARLLIYAILKHSTLMHHFVDEFSSVQEYQGFILKMQESIERAGQVIKRTYTRPAGTTLH